MRKIQRYLCALLLIAPACPLSAKALDLDREPIYVRKGFEEPWVRRIPAPGGAGWLLIPGVEAGGRRVVLGELPFPDMPRRKMFSPEKRAPENFTFLAPFTLDGWVPALNSFLGVYFANIGENWSVFINGHHLKSEIHMNDRGEIERYRHMRDVLIPIDPRILHEGENILAVRIVGDPTNIDAGFHRSTPFVIDTLPRLQAMRSEQAALVLIFLYLFFGIYHLFIFIRRKDEKYNFWYAAFSILLFVYLLSRTHAIYALVPDSTILHRIEYCSLYVLVPLIGAFLDLLLTGGYARITRIYAAFYTLLVAVTLMPVSNAFAIDVLRVWQVTVMIPLAYYLFVRIGRPVFSASRKNFMVDARVFFPLRAARAIGRALSSTTAGKLLLGAVVLAACALFDILDSMFWAYNYVATTYGFFVFIMGISLILADRFLHSHRELEKSSELAASEMELAAHMQSHLLAALPAGLEGWDLALSFRPKYGASGDFYDFYCQGDRLQGIALFDVSGHGVSSALITMMIKPVTYRIFNSMRNEGLESIINLVNRQVCMDLSRLDNYVTCVLLRVSGGRVEYVNAGHPDLLRRAHATGEVTVVDAGGKSFRGEPLGVDLDHRRPSVIELDVGEGDILLLYTDCILDAQNDRKERYGLDRVIDSLRAAPDGTAAEVLDFMLERFFSFAPESGLKDDFTVILAKKTA